MRFQTLVRVNSASGKSAEELQSHALFTPFLFALSKMSLRRPVQAPELQCSLCFSCPFLSCRMQRSSCKDTKQGDWGKSMTPQRKRRDRGEECVEVQERRDTNEREWERQTDCWRWRSPFLFFLFFENVFIFRQEPECESVNQPAGPWSLSSMSEPVTAAAAETATSLQQLPTNV